MGEVPLEQLAKISKNLTFDKFERDHTLYSLDINGYRSKRPVSHITKDAEAALKKVKSNDDIIMTQEGDIVQINDSFQHMITVLPLSMIGTAWGYAPFP